MANGPLTQSLHKNLIDQYGPALRVVLRQRIGMADGEAVADVVRRAKACSSADKNWAKALQLALPERSDHASEIPAASTPERTRAFLESLPQDLDREVLRRYYEKQESRLRICHALKLSEHRFEQIIENGLVSFCREHETEAPTTASTQQTLAGQLIDRYLLNQLDPEQSAKAELAILSDPQLRRRAEIAQQLVLCLKSEAGANTGASPGYSSGRDWGRLARGAAMVAIAVAGLVWWATTAFLTEVPLVKTAAVDDIASANVATVELGLTRGARIVPELRLAQDQTLAFVALDVGIPETELYKIQLLTANDRLIWDTEQARPADDERIYLAINTSRLGSGEYHFVAEPADGFGDRIRLPLYIRYGD